MPAAEPGGVRRLTDDPGFAFATMWGDVVSELNGENGNTLQPLTPQQRAWLKLVKPLTIVEGFALLSVPSSFVQNEIERHLRTQITDALSRRLGQRVELGVRIAPADARDDTESSGEDNASRPGHASPGYSGPPQTETDSDEVDEDGDDASRRERVEDRAQHALHHLQRGWFRRVDFDWNRLGSSRWRRTPTGARSRCRCSRA